MSPTRPQHRQLRKRWIVLLLALFATGVLATLGSVAFQRKVDSFRWLGFEAEPSQGLWQVNTVQSGETGLRAGDGLFPPPGVAAGDLEALRTALHAMPSTALRVMRDSEVVQVTYQRPGLRIDRPYLVLCLIGTVYLLIGLFTVFKDPRGPARLFFLWCLTSAGLYILTPRLPPLDNLDEAIFLADQLARSLLPALTLHLFLVFPSTLTRWRRAGAVVPFLYLPAAALLALHADWIFFGGELIAGRPTAAKLAALDTVDLTLLVAFAVAGVAVLMARLRRADWEQRRQVQWIALGVLGGYVPFLLLYVLPRALGLGIASWLATPAVVPLACVPLGFAYAILKYKLWDIGSILRDTIAYSLTALVGIFGFVLINLAISRGVGDELGAVRNLLTFMAGIGIASVLVPTKSAITSRLEQLRYGSRLAQRRALVRLGQSLVYERDLDRLCATVLEHLGTGLEVEKVNLYLVEGGALAPVRLGDRAPRQLPGDAFGPGFWRRDVHRLAAVRVPLERPLPEQRLFAAGYRYAFPLRVRESRIGVALLGFGPDGAPLTGEDLSLVRGLLDQAGLAIENARLLEEVHRQLAEVTRLESHNKGIIESSPAGIVVLDADDRIAQANHAFAAIVEIDRPQLPGRPLAEVLPVQPLPTAGDGVIDVSYCEADGRERYLHLSIADYASASEPGLRVLVVQDISERVALEQAVRQRERLASLGMVAAGVAHEVNTPLTGISSYAQMLLDEIGADHPHRAILEKMERQTFRASQIVNNLLEFARNRGDAAQPVAISRVLDECLEAAAGRAAGAGIALDFASPSDEIASRLRVRGHEGELGQVFTNLIGNALDAIERSGGGAAVEVGEHAVAIALDEHDGWVRVRVTDTGPGIPEERLERIFEPFFSSKLGSGGTGLGLAITHNIVRRHGGEIGAENRADRRGCRFTVTLPRLALD